MYVNRNAINISGINRAFIIEDDINREKRDNVGHIYIIRASEPIFTLSEL